MLLHDGIGDRQPEPGPLADLFRREKRVEDLRLKIVRNSRSVVVDLENHAVVFDALPAADDEDAAAVGRQHRLLGVDHEIEQHLLDLVAVGEDLRQPGRERVEDIDVGHPLFVRAQRERFARHLIDVDHRAGRIPLARERQQATDDAGGALGFAQDGLEPAPDGLVEHRALRQALGPGQDRGKRVVQLVRDAGDRLAQGGHFFGLQELVIEVAFLVVQLLALADVTDQRVDADGALASLRVGARGELDPHGAVVGAPQPQQVVGDRPVGGEPLEQGDASLRIDEAVAVERPHVAFDGFAGVAEDQLEVWIRGDRGCGIGPERPDVDAFMDAVEQARERGGTSFHARIIERVTTCPAIRRDRVRRSSRRRRAPSSRTPVSAAPSPRSGRTHARS